MSKFKLTMFRWVIPIIGFIGIGVSVVAISAHLFFGKTIDVNQSMIAATYSILLIFWASFEEWKLLQTKKD